MSASCLSNLNQSRVYIAVTPYCARKKRITDIYLSHTPLPSYRTSALQTNIVWFFFWTLGLNKRALPTGYPSIHGTLGIETLHVFLSRVKTDSCKFMHVSETKEPVLETRRQSPGSKKFEKRIKAALVKDEQTTPPYSVLGASSSSCSDS